eukprot:TRINITY_DN43504_c0_g1_i1.p1 TRINITY_DN43504_c0_g1~~TRINITY_DN43504_c0_g1_i1.p1  ORF type:complete len:517 (-),score=75.74 TRINITY_DN43504_c0_g1_i1:143-1693(-)
MDPPSSFGQESLLRRLENLRPADFGEDVIFSAPEEWSPPQELADSWHSTERNHDVAVAILFADPSDPAHVSWLRDVIDQYSRAETLAPVVCFVKHFADPSKKDFELLTFTQAHADQGVEVDGVVNGDVSGFELALTVRCQVLKTSRIEQTVHEQMCNRRFCEEDLAYWRSSAEWMLWENPRMVHALQIPHIDFQHADGLPVEGEPMFEMRLGKVYKTATPEQNEANEVRSQRMLLAVEKGRFTCMQDVGGLKRMVHALRLVSSVEHQNIVYLHEIRHSQTHLLFTLDSVGELTLRQRLIMRERSSSASLPSRKVVSIIEQATRAVYHLHHEFNVAHLDLRPESFGLLEKDDSILVKLFGFESSLVRKGDSDKCSLRGTAPYIAPEVFANVGGVFCAQQADIWSLGVAFLELQCGQLSVRRFFDVDFAASQLPGRSVSAAQGAKVKAVAECVAFRIQEAMSPPRAISTFLLECCKPELRNLLPVAQPTFSGMLRTSCNRRWSSEHVAAAVRTFPQVA